MSCLEDKVGGLGIVLRCDVLRCVLFLLVCTLLPSFVYAQTAQDPVLVVDIDSLESPSEMAVQVLDFNSIEDPLEDQSPVQEASVVLYNTGGTEMARVPAGGYRTLIDYSEGISAIGIVSGSEVLFRRSMSFCDGDAVCDICDDGLCSVVENVLTCSDCASGSLDYFCDMRSDGVCDPDCSGGIGDEDCLSECTQYCGMAVPEASGSCESFGGVACEPRQDCIGGTMLMTYDANDCCVGGFCADLDSYVESVARMQESPGTTVTPLGMLASEIDSMGGPEEVCADMYGGFLCFAGSRCQGTARLLYYGNVCCVGRCLPVADPTWSYDEEEAQPDLSDEEMMFADELAFDDPLADATTAFEAEELEMRGESGERDVVQLEEEEVLIAAVEAARPEVPTIKTQVFVFTSAYAGMIVVVLLVILLVCLVLFRRYAGSRLSKEEEQVRQMQQPAPRQDGAPSMVSGQSDSRQQDLGRQDIQSVIDSLVLKRYSYAQIRLLLLRQGYGSQFVDAQIMRNYNRRQRGVK